MTPYDRLTHYLNATGWLAPTDPGPAGGLWRHPYSELLLPVPNDLLEDGIDWQRLVERLALVEEAAIADVLARLDGRMVDIANLRAANDIVISDTIPFAAGVTLVREGWTMLRASATTSLGPRPFIRRYRPAGDEIVEHARMAHTKRGSFVIPIHLPIPEPEAQREEAEPMLEGLEVEPPESEQRRVMRTFAESLAAIDAFAVQPEGEPTSDNVHDLVVAGVSYEFASALHRVLDEDSVSEFSASFEWAPSGGPPPSSPARIAVSSSARERIKIVASKLKAPAAPQRMTEELTGPIIRVERHIDTDTGVVTVQAVRAGRVAHVNVNVSSGRLDEALVWMRARETVVVESHVHRTSAGLIADSRDAVTPLQTRHLI